MVTSSDNIEKGREKKYSPKNTQHGGDLTRNTREMRDRQTMLEENRDHHARNRCPPFDHYPT